MSRSLQRPGCLVGPEDPGTVRCRARLSLRVAIARRTDMLLWAAKLVMSSHSWSAMAGQLSL